MPTDADQHAIDFVYLPAVPGVANPMVRSVCSCGWEGRWHREEADAEKEGARHIAPRCPACGRVA